MVAPWRLRGVVGLALVVGTLHQEDVTVLANGDRTGDDPLEGSLRALHRDAAVGDGDVHAARDGNGVLADT
jgi:hypothetical protein